MEDYGHTSVLLGECIEALQIRPDGVYVDGTLGMGGHSAEIARRLSTGRLIAIDRDAEAIRRAKVRLAPFTARITLSNAASSLSSDLSPRVLPSFQYL